MNLLILIDFLFNDRFSSIIIDFITNSFWVKQNLLQFISKSLLTTVIIYLVILGVIFRFAKYT